MASAFQQVHDGLTRAETTIDYAAPPGSLPAGFGIGPSGTMKIEILTNLVTPGFERGGDGTIQLMYHIPTSAQRSYQPNPGVAFEGIRRRSYIPNVPEGRCLLTRYKYAFLHGHMFLVGFSVTKNEDNQVTWSTLPNHTTMKGTAFGFPDPEYINNANRALDQLGVPSADAIVKPQHSTAATLVTPIALPNKSSGRNTAAVTSIPFAVDAVPLPPPYLSPATPNLAGVTIPDSWTLSSKEAKKCAVLSEDDVEVKRLRTLNIPIAASEIVVSVHVKDLTEESQLQDSTYLSAMTATRASRSALLTRGSVQLKKLSMMKAGPFAAVTDRGNPNIKFGIFDLRAVHMHRDVVILAFRQEQQADGNSNAGGTNQSNKDRCQFALYQTPEPSRFLAPLAVAAVAAYVGVPNWAVPIAWSGSLPALQTITKRDYKNWMGTDGGFSSSLYAAALAYHVQHKIDIGKLVTDTPVAVFVASHQPKRRVPTPGPQLMNLMELAMSLGSDNAMIHRLVEHGLNALAFNLVFRRLRLSKYRLPADITAFRNALLKALLYNVTLREVDLSGTNLSGLGECIGKSLAMNAQPLIASVNFSNCHLTGRDLRGLLPGLSRIWCGETAFLESLKVAGNNLVPGAAWDLFFGTLNDPSILPLWPQAPPPPPSLAFLQELDLINTKAIGPGLIALSEKLSGLRSLKLSSSGYQSEDADIFNSLVVAKAPLESFVGKDMINSYSSVLVGALFSLSKTLKTLNFDGFRGDATPLLCGWPVAVPKLRVYFHGKLSGATFSHPTRIGFAPGSLQIENNDAFGASAVDRALAIQASGLKVLVLDKMHYSQLSKAIPVLAFCGLLSLRVQQGETKCVAENSDVFWSVFASSTTLKDLHLPKQLCGPSDVARVGRFLKTNRSVQRISFDNSIVLDVESVKVLRLAFYGNKKVIDMEHLQLAKDRTMAHIKRTTQAESQKVSRAKASIKQIFRSHYSKYNRNWRAKPNQLKLPYVEQIRVAKRRIGQLQKDSNKIGALLGEIKTIIDRNRRERMTIEEVNTTVKLARRERQLQQLAFRKMKFLKRLVTQLHKSKQRGRQNKSAKKQVPRSTYYKSSNMWPLASQSPTQSPQHRRVHSSYRYYNDPYLVRYPHHYGYCSAPNTTYYMDNTDCTAGPAITMTPEPSHCDSSIAAVAIMSHTNAVWDGLLCDVGNLTPGVTDPWESVDALIQYAEANLDAVCSPDFLSEVHHEVAELGSDAITDICGTLDDGAAVNDKVNEISDSLDVPADTIGALVDSNLDTFDLSALEAALGDVPDYDGDIMDIADAADADDVIDMYAGAGPRDLEDGGPSFGGSGVAALAGARRRARTRKENRKLKRAREKASNRLQAGYKSLAFPTESPQVGRYVMSVWPNDLREEWIEDTRAHQIQAMSQSSLFLLPAVSENEHTLLVEWDVPEAGSSSDIEVVLVSQCSLDRLPNLERQLAAWKGKASIAIYLKPDECCADAEQVILSCIRNVRGCSEQPHSGIGNYDIAVTLVEGSLDDEQYPINLLRNIALLEARHQHLRFHPSLERSAVLLVDVDFRPSVNLCETLHTQSASKVILEYRQVVCVPAFESAAELCPNSLLGLQECVANNLVEGFHLSHFPQGHGPTQYETFWTQSLQCEAGNVESNWQKCYTVQYENLFEPYIVMASRDVPLYDERFVGYGLNKVSHLANVAARQKSNRFIVLPGVFLVAPVHERSDSWANRYGSQTDETKYNQLWLKGLYHNFMRGLAEGKKALVSDQTRAKHCLQCLQDNEEANTIDKDFQFTQLSARRSLVASLITAHPCA